MSTERGMKDEDVQMRHDVEAELEWDPRFDAREIGVTVKNHVVSLTGHVGCYAQSRAALEAAQSVEGVSAVANELHTGWPTESALTDSDVAESAIQALRSHGVPNAGIKIAVQCGWVSLEGVVDNWTQKQAAERVVNSLCGVVGVTNTIAVREQASSVDVKGYILDAFRRLARVEFERIRVSTLDGIVTLEGEVGSLQERQHAESAAWKAPGVSQVIDKLTVDPNPSGRLLCTL
jgi:osmotically-inducible protein OsmY